MKIRVKENYLQQKFRLPPIGYRIRKTGIAVFLCLLIYYFSGEKLFVGQSCVTAIICIQPFWKDSLQSSIDRIVGILFGTIWGLILLQMLEIFPVFASHLLIVYALMALGVVVTIYSTVVVRQTNNAALAAIVYLGIVLDYPNIEAPFLQAGHTFLATFVGIFIAAMVDNYRLPRKKHPEYIFFVLLQDLVPDRYAQVTPQVLVLLNRLFDEGARISLVSKWAPAFLLSQMGTMNINMPVIVMSGAALYDIPNKQYRNVYAVSREDKYLMAKHLMRICGGYCMYTVHESNMFVYQRGEMNTYEMEDYDLMKRSPYRNYVSGELSEDDQIAFIRVIHSDQVIDEYEKLLKPLLPDTMRMEKRKQPRQEKCSGLYFFNKYATVENQKAVMIQELLDQEHGVVPVDMISLEQNYSDREAIHLLDKLRDIYEPIS